MATTAVARETIFTLRREIAKIEGRLPESLAPAGSPQDATVLRHGGAAEREGAFIATGAERLDQALGGGLPKAALTEIHGSETRNAGVTAGFTLALAGLILKASAKGLPLLWIGSAEIFREAGFPYAPGLVHQFGIAPEDFLFSEVSKLA